MIITKITKFSEDEICTLTQAGKLLGDLDRSIQSNEIDVIEEDSKALLTALSDVLTKIISK